MKKYKFYVSSKTKLLNAPEKKNLWDRDKSMKSEHLVWNGNYCSVDLDNLCRWRLQ